MNKEQTDAALNALKNIESYMYECEIMCTEISACVRTVEKTILDALTIADESVSNPNVTTADRASKHVFDKSGFKVLPIKSPNNPDPVDLNAAYRDVIKPLQWQVRRNGTKFCNTVVGHYEIGEDGFIYSPFVCQCSSYEEAMSSCNNDYRDKVRTCLK